MGGLGMMAGRAHRAEGVGALARHHRIDRRRDGARRAQGGLARAGRQDRVGIERGIALLRHGIQQCVDKSARVGAGDVLKPRLGRLAPV